MPKVSHPDPSEEKIFLMILKFRIWQYLFFLMLEETKFTLTSKIFVDENPLILGVL